MQEYQTGKPKRGRLRLWRLMDQTLPWYVVLVIIAALLLMGWLLASRQDPDILRLQAVIEDAKDQVYDKERQVLRLGERISLAQTDQFIANEARTKHGYLFPGEIRFVVTNPEVLGLPPRNDTPGEGQGLEVPSP